MEWTKKLKLFIGFSLFSANAFSADTTGYIGVVNIHKDPGWNAAFIQIVDKNGTKISLGEDCSSSSSWVMWKIEDDLDKAVLSIALAAKISKQEVRIFTSGCYTKENDGIIADQVKLVAIDLGIRD